MLELEKLLDQWAPRLHSNEEIGPRIERETTRKPLEILTWMSKSLLLEFYGFKLLVWSLV
ncbi:hypothetical protein F8388_020359 [Cannabis sativa]|uniref:Uncharacterized protein n=1 Tax=Cannabis sativa TaxID=3483 RepID=A0A7J6HGX3_CANSA|nr:hypothetical protein F8388_020359 [Cannabis sativa]